MLEYSPKRRYSAVVMFSDDLEHVLLIHKLKPDWQAGKANFPGGKVEGTAPNRFSCNGTGDWPRDHWHDIEEKVYFACAVRELREETGLNAADLKLFCRLRFTSREGEEAECCFFTARGPIELARTMETEHVFEDSYYSVVTNDTGYWADDSDTNYVRVPSLPELPWLVAMAKEALETNCAPRTVYQ